MDLSIKGQLKKYRTNAMGTSTSLDRIDSWVRRDILVVTNKTEEIVKLFGDHVVVLAESEYVPPIMKIGLVYAAATVRLSNQSWWDDLRLRSTDKAIHLM